MRNKSQTLLHKAYHIDCRDPSKFLGQQSSNSEFYTALEKKYKILEKKKNKQTKKGEKEKQ